MALIEQVFPGGNQTTSSDRFTVEQIKNAGAGTTMPWQNNRTLSSGSYTIMLEGQIQAAGWNVRRVGRSRFQVARCRWRY